VSELEMIVNDFRVNYMTYVVEFDVECVSWLYLLSYKFVCFFIYAIWFWICLLLLQGVVMLPSMFAHNFGDSIDRYATLVDTNHNEFEVLVQRNNHGIYLTKGWTALRDFYNISIGLGKFGINIKDRFGKLLRLPCWKY